MGKPTIHCGPHGDSPFSAICRHLRDGAGLRYFSLKFPPDHPADRQAWCEGCHALLEEEGGWNDRSFERSGMSLVCTGCFEAALGRHERIDLPLGQVEDDDLCWYEFPFIADDDEEVVARLEALLDIATTLEVAGWPMRFTLTGLSFGVPLEDEGEVAEQLARLGVSEHFSPSLSPTLAEARKALDELDDRVWYERTLALMKRPGYGPAEEFAGRHDDLRAVLRRMQRVEQRGLEEKFPVEDSFGWGMVNGKLSAVRWLFGDHWDMLDT